MDFFQAQDKARQRTSLLVAYFIAALIGIIVVLYAVIVISFRTAEAQQAGPESYGEPVSYWDPAILAVVATGTLAVVGLGSLFKTIALRAGGGAVALSLGGRKISPHTTDMRERRLVNVVEEMAIASGVRVPEIYLLPDEAGINAFAAGWTPDSAAVAVTQGAVDTLTRDELQGVVAHEFSHILNGDMRLNIRLIGLLFGILLLTVIGRGILRAASMGRRSSGRGKGNPAPLLALGLALIIVGYIGVLFGRLIQAAVSRQREFLADAAAVQFTRNPTGIAGALKKIGGLASGSRIGSAHATESSHLFFANAMASSASGALATHPPLVERIRAIEPAFDGRFPSVTLSPASESPLGGASTPTRSPKPPPLRPEQFLAALAAGVTASPDRAGRMLAALPTELRDAAHDPEIAPSLLLALLAHAADEATAARTRVVLEESLGSAGMVRTLKYARETASLDDESRLALLDLTLPALRELPPPSVSKLLEVQDQLIGADYRTTPFEFALAHVVRRALGAAMAPAGSRPPPLPALSVALPADVAVLLDAIARATPGRDENEIASAYRAGSGAFGLTGELAAAPRERVNALNALALPLQRLERAPMGERGRVIAALAHAAAADGVIQPEEHALLRAFAAAMDCPAPLLAAGRGSDRSV